MLRYPISKNVLIYKTNYKPVITELLYEMKPVTKADLLQIAESQRKFTVNHYVKGVYQDVRTESLHYKTQYITDCTFPQDILEDVKIALQQLFPDSKIEIVEKTLSTSKDGISIWNFLPVSKMPMEKKYRAIQIDWST